MGGVAVDRGFLALVWAVQLVFLLALAFAAFALLLRARNHRVDRRRRRLMATWEGPMLEVLAGAAPDSALTEHVEHRDRLFFLSFLLGYARRLQGEERAVVERLAKPYLPEIALKARHRSEAIRGQAVQTLAEIGLPLHAGAVASALSDPSPVVAMIGARGLFRRGYEQYFATVLRHLPRFTVWSRSFLSSMLVRGGPEASPILREMLSDPTHQPLVRAVVADGLRLLNDIEAVPVAAAVLATQELEDRELLAACLRIVRHLGHEAHLPSVRPRLAAADPVVRATAAGALGAIGGPSEIPLLESLLDDPEHWVSLEAARGLRSLGAAQTLERLGTSEGDVAVLARQVLAE